MKNLSLSLLTKVFFTASCIFLMATSCEIDRDVRHLDGIYGGRFELRRINMQTSPNTTSSGWFFICVGGYDSKTINETTIKLYFKNKQGQYEFMEKPSKDVNIQIEDSVNVPYMTYRYTKSDIVEISGEHGNGYPLFTEECLPYLKIVIHCKESDFAPEININNLK